MGSLFKQVRSLFGNEDDDQVLRAHYGEMIMSDEPKDSKVLIQKKTKGQQSMARQITKDPRESTSSAALTIKPPPSQPIAVASKQVRLYIFNALGLFACFAS
jgi:hypothetical protein